MLLQFLHISQLKKEDIASEMYEDEVNLPRSCLHLNNSFKSACWSDHNLDPDDIRVNILGPKQHTGQDKAYKSLIGVQCTNYIDNYNILIISQYTVTLCPILAYYTGNINYSLNKVTPM